jgi:hypothetical protein
MRFGLWSASSSFLKKRTKKFLSLCVVAILDAELKSLFASFSSEKEDLP